MDLVLKPGKTGGVHEVLKGGRYLRDQEVVEDDGHEEDHKNKKKSLHVVAIDYGIKKNILRYFSNFNCKVTIVSCKTSASDILKLNPNGVFLSNGPGDPAATGKYAIPIIKKFIKIIMLIKFFQKKS